MWGKDVLGEAGGMAPMAIQSSRGYIWLDVTLFIYNFMCFAGTLVHENNTYEAMMTKKSRQANCYFSKGTMLAPPIKNTAYASLWEPKQALGASMNQCKKLLSLKHSVRAT